MLFPINGFLISTSENKIALKSLKCKSCIDNKIPFSHRTLQIVVFDMELKYSLTFFFFWCTNRSAHFIQRPHFISSKHRNSINHILLKRSLLASGTLFLFLLSVSFIRVIYFLSIFPYDINYIQNVYGIISARVGTFSRN